MNTLTIDDLLWITNRIPWAVKQQMKKHAGQLALAGGFIRSCVARETVNDIDLFVPSMALATEIAKELASDKGKRIHTTQNALTIIGHKYTIQIITRWTFDNPASVVPSFDFTIACAAVWWEGTSTVNAEGETTYIGKWHSLTHERYYPDLAAKRLVYTQPERNEDAGGSMLRVLKFYQRGYTITLGSLGAVMGRMLRGIPFDKFENRKGMDDAAWEKQIGHVMTGLLREVDPQIDPDHLAHLPDAPKEAEPENVL